MKNYDLSILIPARNEMFLSQTVSNILQNIRGKTEIIVILDGSWANPPIPDAQNLTVVYHHTSIGQRAATNEAARLSNAKYLMKIDAHCQVDEGFDVKMIAEMHDDWTMVPMMYNLHGFDWVCEEGHRQYQGPTPTKGCNQCGKPMKKEIIFKRRESRQSTFYRFDKTLHFQYYGSFKEREEAKIGVITGYKLSFDAMSIPVNIINLLTYFANSHQLTSCRNLFRSGKDMAMNTMSFPLIDNGIGVGSVKVDCISNQIQMDRITAFSIFTKMVKDRNIPSSTRGDGTDEPSIEDSMGEAFITENCTSSITFGVNSCNPIPTPGCIIKSDVVDKFNNILGGEFVYNEKTNSFHNGSVTLTLIRNKDIAPTLSIQGSCFMLTRERYWALNICDEAHGSWGQQGVEVACKTWLSGGQVMVNKKTWYAHLFRTQGGDFGFPYPLSGSDIDHARKYSREQFIDGKFKGKYDLKWLLDKFYPVPDWHISSNPIKRTKGVVYYTTNVGDELMLDKCRKQITKGIKEKHIISVSLNQSIKLGTNIVLKLEPGYLTMAKQILEGLVKSTSDVIYLCEHDVLYHPTHFSFIPPREDVIYYNTNVWRVRVEDNHCLYCNNLKQLSGLVAYRKTLIKHYTKRVEILENKYRELQLKEDEFYPKDNFYNLRMQEFNRYVRQMGFEPGTHRRNERVDDLTSDVFQSQFPNLDLRHKLNLTPSRWRKDQFRNKIYTQGWTEANEVPGWGKIDVTNILKNI